MLSNLQFLVFGKKSSILSVFIKYCSVMEGFSLFESQVGTPSGFLKTPSFCHMPDQSVSGTITPLDVSTQQVRRYFLDLLVQ